ncbi:MAG: winged helix-turn-helix domain-containing protein [Microcoleus sp. SIO2G3]|nr:winged helix-turn-helix domain-containing protein [Microcoleus sp. SIO2G3]
MNSFAQDQEGAEAAIASQPLPALLERAIAAEVDHAPALDPDWLKRPEAVVLATFAVLLVLWQLYQELLDEAGADAGLSGIELARRLGVSYSTVQRRKLREDFAQWSRNLDPDRLSWTYKNRRFFPQVLSD